MKILLDDSGMRRVFFGWETSDYTRYYVAEAPARVIVMFPSGLRSESLTGAVVEVASGEGIGLAGRVRRRNVGELHTKIMIVQRVNGLPDTTLSQMLEAGRQEVP